MNTKLIKFTDTDFMKFPVKKGYKQCPFGDYSNIKNFPDKCRFDEHCKFGSNHTFGDNTKFGDCCTFKTNNKFGQRSFFGNWCAFLADNTFGINCEIPENCLKVDKAA